MAFSPVPSDSKNSINKAGRILSRGDSTYATLVAAITLVDKWRACHAYPINTFQSTLRTKLKKAFPDAIVAQRLKRMPTILDKLRRYPNMQLTTMQDIGGVRAILGSVDDVYRLADEYREKSRFTHELLKENDYIKNPRSEDGYRSLHLIYRYKNDLYAPAYNGLLLELQIRTKLQHTWATAVETMGTVLGQALKSRQGDREWLEFFAVTSSAFSYMEGSAHIPRFEHMARLETYQAVAKAEKKLKAISTMRALSAAVQRIADSKGARKAGFYHLIVLNSLEKSVTITAYTRENISIAMADYEDAEKRAANGETIEPVLVAAGPIDTLRHAYPNFFLDITDFLDKVTEIVSSAKAGAQATG